MAFLLILLLLFGFVLGGIGNGTSSSSTTGPVKPVVKCSKRMPARAPGVQEQRCGPPPANP
jgi:hypothetical protein